MYVIGFFFQVRKVQRQQDSPLKARMIHAKISGPLYIQNVVDGWMNGVLGHFYALSRLNWAGDNLG